MGWIYLSVAIVFEVTGTVFLKMSDGMSRLGPALVVLACYSVSFTLLALTLKTLEVGIAYAIWSAVGTAAIAVLGILVFGESVSAAKVAGLVLIVAGVVSLNLADRAL
nr:multidrug efflux SMR transporter [Azospirillum halopraeferens]